MKYTADDFMAVLTIIEGRPECRRVLGRERLDILRTAMTQAADRVHRQADVVLLLSGEEWKYGAARPMKDESK